MDWGGPGFVIALIAISTIGWVINNWIRAANGYAPSDDFGNTLSKVDPDAERRIELLTTENGRLTGQVGRLEERISVLERIATDPAERTAREIDSLR
jgi:hypothetical protein